MMKRLHILGRKNHGKTTLVAELVAHFTAAGYRVGTIKHTHHEHELDLPGKDSYRHRQAGAAAAGILSRSMCAVFWPSSARTGPSADPYAQFTLHFHDCDFVLVEGDVAATAPKIEVWRQAAGEEPLAALDGSIAAIVSDDAIPISAARWQRSDLPAVARHILDLLAVARR